MNGPEMTRTLFDAARRGGWLGFHPTPAVRRDGRIMTPFQGDRGFPDLTFAHPVLHHTLFLEVKAGKDRATPEQLGWLAATSSGTTAADIVNEDNLDLWLTYLANRPSGARW